MRFFFGLISIPAAFVLLLIIEGFYAQRGSSIEFEAPDGTLQDQGPDAMLYCVLGDSTGAGQGASPGMGIAEQTRDSLATPIADVSLRNFCLSGALMGELPEQARKAASYKPDIVLISMGANTITHAESNKKAATALLEAIRILRTANPHVVIIYTGCPDMGSTPRLPRPLRDVVGLRESMFNAKVLPLAAKEGCIIAPIAQWTGKAFRSDRSLFSSDQFHPNDKGYQQWMKVLAPAMGKALEEHYSR